jgi:hypothetical protein
VYFVPAATDPLLFGDVFSSEWLFDTVINEDAVSLAPINLSRGQGRGYAPLTPDSPFKTDKDFLLAHGRSCRAVLLSDDCEIETCLIRREGRGRLVFAAVAPWPADPEEAAKAMERTTFRRHPLRPHNGFEGGIVDLVRLFAVSGKALVQTERRVVSLGETERAALEQRWAAFATRRGPLAAADNVTKLAHVLDARDDVGRFKLLHDGNALPTDATQEVAKAVQMTLNQAWRTEGEIMQKIADVHEARSAGREEVELLEAELRTLGELATAAADRLRTQTETA